MLTFGIGNIEPRICVVQQYTPKYTKKNLNAMRVPELHLSVCNGLYASSGVAREMLLDAAFLDATSKPPCAGWASVVIRFSGLISRKAMATIAAPRHSTLSTQLTEQPMARLYTLGEHRPWCFPTSDV